MPSGYNDWKNPEQTNRTKSRYIYIYKKDDGHELKINSKPVQLRILFFLWSKNQIFMKVFHSCSVLIDREDPRDKVETSLHAAMCRCF